MFARDEDANSRVHLHLATRSSCFHVEVVAAFHVRARCTIRLSTVMHSRHVAVLLVSAFSVPAIFDRRLSTEAKLASAVRFPLLFVHSPRPRSYSPRDDHDRVHFL